MLDDFVRVGVKPFSTNSITTPGITAQDVLGSPPPELPAK